MGLVLPVIFVDVFFLSCSHPMRLPLRCRRIADACDKGFQGLRVGNICHCVACSSFWTKFVTVSACFYTNSLIVIFFLVNGLVKPFASS